MTSPLFQQLPQQRRLQMALQAPLGKVVHLEFLSFNVESDEYVKNCSHDALFIYDGYFPYGDILGQLCGHSLPENQISSGRNMTLHFVSDYGLTYSGFKIRYSFNDSEAIALEGCEGFTHIYDNPSGGNMTSPMFPKNYPNNADCKWLFVAPAGKVVHVEFLSFNVELSSDCNYDALVVYDGVEEDGVLLGQLCGHSLPMNQVSSSRNMAMHFVSSSYMSYSGFQIRYSFNYYGGLASKSSKPQAAIV
ncbi:PREDICTED: exoskeleton protein RP43-like [Priapulus caudatus]|uniref:Exoskeleton protein RP43-like n=1 Tax=Priapulus caudatus TaxID=37621 RepID=A0ABM1F581_PRICU|nr:PREDICTED: exoskeleton protein RP43-like [Priapulus caudatus]